MGKLASTWGVLLLIMLVATSAVAFDRQQIQPTGTAHQIEIGGQDVITASDAGGGYLTTQDILLIVLIVLAIFGLAAIL